MKSNDLHRHFLKEYINGQWTEENMLNIIKYQEVKMNNIMYYGPTPVRKVCSKVLVIASIWAKRGSMFTDGGKTNL